MSAPPRESIIYNDNSKYRNSEEKIESVPSQSIGKQQNVEENKTDPSHQDSHGKICERVTKLKNWLMHISAHIKNCWRAMNRYEQSQIVLTSFGLLVLIVYAIATIGMYFANRKSADAAQSAADAAKNAAEQAVTQNKLSRYALVAVNRSLVEIIHKEGRENLDLQYLNLDDPKGRLAFNVWMENVGNAPVINMNYQITAEVRDAQQQPSFIYNGYGGIAGPLPHGMDRRVPVSVPDFSPKGNGPVPMIITPQLRRDLIQGDKYIAVFGRIQYEDSFGHWWIQFCVHREFYQGSPTKLFNARSCIAYDKEGGKEKEDWP